MGNIDIARSVAAKCRSLTVEDNESEADYWISDSSYSRGFAYSAMKGWYSHFVSNQNGDLIAHPTNRIRTGLWVDSTCHVSGFSTEFNGKSAQDEFISQVRSFGFTYRKYRSCERVDYIPEKKGGASFIFLPPGRGILSVTLQISHMRSWPSESSGSQYETQELPDGVSVKSEVAQTFIHVTPGTKMRREICPDGVALHIDIESASEIYVSGDGSYPEADEMERAIAFHDSVKYLSVLKTPDFRLNKLFLWTKHDLMELFSHSSVGSGFYAGLPGFSWFFGRDGEWMSLAATESGLHDLSRQHLELLWKYSRDGRIPHELPLFSENNDYGFDINGDLVRTRFLSIDSAPLWIINALHLANWSGEKRDMDRINEVMNFIKSCDRDGDGLVENRFSEGLIGWVEEWAKDRDGACVDVNALCIQAEKMLELSSGLSDGRWKRSIGYYIENFIKQSGEKTTIWDSIDGNERREVKTPMSLIPLAYFPSELREFSRAVLEEYSHGDMLVPWGMRSLSYNSTMYDDGYHTGMVWPLMTGWAGLSFFSSCIPDIGLKLLNTFVTLAYSSPSTGRIGEVYSSSDMRETGQFFQGWSSALFISTVVEGLMGMSLDSMCHEDWQSRISPYLPPDWKEMEMLNVKKGDEYLDIRIDSEGVSVKESENVIKYGRQGRK